MNFRNHLAGKVVTLMLIYPVFSLAQSPSSVASTTASSSLVTKYDRFKDRTVVILTVQNALSLLIFYSGRERVGWENRALLINGPGHSGYPSELIFLADGKRTQVEPMENGSSATPIVAVDIEILQGLLKARKLEAAIIYGDGRSEITFERADVQALKNFVDASGYESAPAIAKRKEAEEANLERLKMIARVTSSQGNVQYLVDATGSMLTTIVRLKEILTESIQSLSPKQQFGITVDGEGIPRFETQMATADNKLAAMKFIADIQAGGLDEDSSHILDKVYQSKPGTIIYLSDFDVGWETPEREGLLKRIKLAHVPVNVVLLGSSSMQGGDFVRDQDFAAQIAGGSGGASFHSDYTDDEAGALLAPGLDFPADASAEKKPR